MPCARAVEAVSRRVREGASDAAGGRRMVESAHSAAGEGAGRVAGWFRWPSVEELIEGRVAGGGLPSPLLEHSVRLEADAVLILDRRVFPHEVTWVTARSGAEVADAMRQMVTQSTGPIFAALAGRPVAEALAAVRETGALLIGARPTNNSVGDAVRSVLSTIDIAMEADAPGSPDAAWLVERVEQQAGGQAQYFRARCRSLAGHAAGLLEDGARVLTHCWMDTYLIELVRAVHAQGKRLRYVVTETRP